MSASSRAVDARPGDDADGGTDAERAGRTPLPIERPGVRDGPTLVALAAVVAAFAGVAGAAGAGCGVAAVAVWYAAGTPYAVAVSYVSLVGLFPGGIDPQSFAVTTAGVGALVLASAPRTARVGARDRLRYAAAALASAGALGGVAWLAVGPMGRPLWTGAAATLTALGCGVYGHHRYGVVFVLDRSGEDGAGRSSRDADADPLTDADPTTDTEGETRS